MNHPLSPAGLTPADATTEPAKQAYSLSRDNMPTVRAMNLPSTSGQRAITIYATDTAAHLSNGDQFEFSAGFDVVTVRLVSGRTFQMALKKITMAVQHSTAKVSFWASEAGSEGQYYFLYQGTQQCSLVESSNRPYDESTRKKQCKCYHVERFLSTSTAIRPDAESARWSKDGAILPAEPPTGGGSEPPPV
jgi:hypothetical protein